MASLLCCYYYLFLTNIYALPNRTSTPIDLLLNAAFINGFILTDYVDGAHWYLTTLIGCYIVFAFMKGLPLKYKKILYFAWGGIVLLLHLVLENMLDIGILKIILNIFGGVYTPMVLSGVALSFWNKNRLYSISLEIGGISYSVYLLHQNIGYIIVYKCRKYLGRYSVWMSLVAVVLTCV